MGACSIRQKPGILSIKRLQNSFKKEKRKAGFDSRDDIKHIDKNN